VVDVNRLAQAIKPLLNASANFLSALEDDKAGRNPGPNLIRSGADLIDAYGKFYSLITSSTSGGRDLVPARPANTNLSGTWEGPHGYVTIYHNDQTGIIVVNDGDAYSFVGAAEVDRHITSWVATCNTSDGQNYIWNGVSRSTTMSTVLRNWDTGSSDQFRLERR